MMRQAVPHRLYRDLIAGEAEAVKESPDRRPLDTGSANGTAALTSYSTNVRELL